MLKRMTSNAEVIENGDKYLSGFSTRTATNTSTMSAASRSTGWGTATPASSRA